MKQLHVDKILQYFFIVDGHPLVNGDVAACGKFLPAFDAGDAASQVLWHTEGKWYACAMVEFEVVSMYVGPANGQITLLGRNGELVQTNMGSVVSSSVIGAGDATQQDRPMGPFRRLCQMGKELVAIGGVRDVYEVMGTSSRLVSNGGVQPLRFESELDVLNQVLADDDLWFDAAGSSINDFIAVGSAGRCDEFREDTRREVDIGTNMPLYCACRTRGDDYFVGGHRGRGFLRSGSTWAELSPVPGAGNLCAAVEFGKRLFVCDGQTVYATDGVNWVFEAQAMGVASQVPAHRLNANTGYLVSIAGQEIFRTEDGRSWRTLLG